MIKQNFWIVTKGQMYLLESGRGTIKYAIKGKPKLYTTKQAAEQASVLFGGKSQKVKVRLEEDK